MLFATEETVSEQRQGEWIDDRWKDVELSPWKGSGGIAPLVG